MLKHKKIIVFTLALLSSIIFLSPIDKVSARTFIDNGGGSSTKSTDSSSAGSSNDTAKGGIDCTKVDCSDPAADPKAKCNRDGCDLVDKYINPTIKLLSGIVGLIAAISLIAGGIQYSSAGGDPQKITAAKNRISKTILALVAYMFLFAFLQFIVPGGVFR